MPILSDETEQPNVDPINPETQPKNGMGGASADVPFTTQPFTDTLADQLSAAYGSRGLVARHNTASIGQYMELFEREIKAIQLTDRSKQLSLVMMDSAVYRTHASAIILISRETHSGRNISAVHVFLLEATRVEELPARPLQNAYIGQTQLKLPYTTSDVMTTKYFRQQLRECLQNATGGINREENDQIIDAGKVVIAANLTPCPENEARLKNILFSGALATAHAILRATNRMPHIALTSDALKRIPLKVEPSYSRTQLLGANGLPVRSDVQVSLVQRIKDADRLEGPSVGESILTVSGFVDQVYYGKDTPQQPYGYYNNMPQDMRVFLPRFVMTATDTYLPANGPAFTLLGMAVATVLQYPNQMNPYWARTFTPDLTKKGKKKDLHDIGVLGYDLNFGNDPAQRTGEYIDTKSGEYNEEALVSFIGKTHYMDRMTYAIDVDPSQPGGWATEMFLRAATGDKEVNRELMDAMNKMTGGAFGEIMSRAHGAGWMEMPVVTFNQEVIMGGYYIDDDGLMQDIRNYDYVALLNELMPDRTMVNEIIGTMYNRQASEDIRLANRHRLFTEMLHSFKLTNWFYRLNFSDVVMDAFTAAWQKCKTFPSTDLMSNFVQTGHVDVSTFFNQGYAGQNVGGFANQSYIVTPTAGTQFTGHNTGFGAKLF